MANYLFSENIHGAIVFNETVERCREGEGNRMHEKLVSSLFRPAHGVV